MSQLFDPKLLERIPAVPCTLDDLKHAVQDLRAIVVQMGDANLVHTEKPHTDNAVAAKTVGNQLTLSNIRFALSAGTENGAPIFIAPAAANGWKGLLRGWRCKNWRGENREANVVEFVVLGYEDYTLELPVNTVFGYHVDDEGQNIMLAQPAQTASGGSAADHRKKYAKCQHQWSTAGTVSVKLLDGDGGSEVGSAFDVKIVGGLSSQDPICYKGQQITVEQDAYDDWITNDPTAWGPKIGMVVWMVRDPASLIVLDGSVNISGWGEQDGSANHADNGGIGRDWTTDDGAAVSGTFKPFFITVDDDFGNALKPAGYVAAAGHVHIIKPDATLMGTDNTVSSTCATGTLSIAIDDHPDHTHQVGCACSALNVPADGSTYMGITSLDDHHTSEGGRFLTGNQLAAHSGHGSLTLSHNVSTCTFTPVAHNHEAYMTAVHAALPNKSLVLVERLDNSFESLGI